MIDGLRWKWDLVTIGSCDDYGSMLSSLNGFVILFTCRKHLQSLSPTMTKELLDALEVKGVSPNYISFELSDLLCLCIIVSLWNSLN